MNEIEIDLDVDIELTYNGACLWFLDKEYGHGSNYNENFKPITKEEMIDYIKNKMTYDEFIISILKIIDNNGD